MMDRTMKNSGLRGELLELETMSPHLKEKYRQEVKAMIERKLTRGQRIGWAFGILLCCFFVVIFGWAAISAPPGFPMAGRIWFGLGVVFPIVLIAFSVSVLKRGKLHQVRDQNLSTRLSYAFVLLMMTFALVWGSMMEDQVLGIAMVLFTLVFFITFGVMPMIINRVNQAEWKLREQLLRIELELEEMRETLAKKEEE